MATIVKKVGPETPSTQRVQSFIGNTDFGSGDIIDVQASLLGSVARETTIVCGASDSITVRFNAVHKVFPEVDDNQFQGDRGGERRFDWDNPVEIIDEKQETTIVGPDETFTLPKQVKNIQVVSVSYAPRIIVHT